MDRLNELFNMYGLQPLKNVSWFKKTKHMAIADRCYVEGIGWCTHQPGISYPNDPDLHRVATKDGRIFLAHIDRIYV